MIDGWAVSGDCYIRPFWRWVLAMVQVVVGCRQATSHYISQCWQRSIQENALWGRIRHICVSRQTIIGSDNDLSPGRCQAIIWTNVGILLIRSLETNFSEILSEIHSFSLKKMHLKMSFAKWRLFRLGLNESTHLTPMPHICVSESGQHWFR